MRFADLLPRLKHRLAVRASGVLAAAGGPPDLEELWRDFNRRLSGMFSGGGKRSSNGGASSGGGSEPNMRQFGGGVALILIIVVLLWASSGFFIVPEGQSAAILRFGRFVEMTDKAGFKWRFPYPIESHELVDRQQQRTVEVGYRNNPRNKVPKESLMLTDDTNIIDIQFAVQYRLKSDSGAAADYLFNNKDTPAVVLQAAETAMREVVGKSKMDFVLYEGKEQMAKDAEKLIQQIVDRYKTGIDIVNVTLQNVQPPESVQAAFDDAIKAKQDLERQKNEGQSYANNVIPQARGDAARLLLEADGYRQKVVNNAEGDANRFKQILAEYSKAPQVTRDRIYIDTMQQIYTNSSKVMVDLHNGSQLLYLPLDKLIQQATTEAGNAAAAAPAQADGSRVASTAGAAAATEPAPPGLDARSRDPVRSRERETR